MVTKVLEEPASYILMKKEATVFPHTFGDDPSKEIYVLGPEEYNKLTFICLIEKLPPLSDPEKFRSSLCLRDISRVHKITWPLVLRDAFLGSKETRA